MTRGQYFQSNRRTRIYLDALAEVMGHHGLQALLRLAGLEAWIDQPPTYDDALEVDFIDFAMLNKTLEDMYGPRGGRALALRAGRASFKEAITQMGGSVGLAGAAFKMLPLRTRIKALLDAVVKGMSLQSSSVASVTEEGGKLFYHVNPCPACWGRTDADRPVCHGTVGFLQEALEWAGGGEEYQIEEAACSAAGEGEPGVCSFLIYKAS